MSLSVRTAFPGRAGVRIFNAKIAVSGNAFERSKPILWRIMSTKFTKMVHGDSLLERLFIRSMVVLLKIEGNCSCLRAKVAHMVGHLPPLSSLRPNSRLTLMTNRPISEKAQDRRSKSPRFPTSVPLLRPWPRLVQPRST